MLERPKLKSIIVVSIGLVTALAGCGSGIDAADENSADVELASVAGDSVDSVDSAALQDTPVSIDPES
jgi:hypothetical protein